MKRFRNKKGFTLAEIMMAVAIIAILAGVSFVGVAGYLRSMAQLERDSIAKEVYVAAQNHLTMAEGQSYLGRSKYGTEEESNTGIYYYIVNSGTVETEANGNFNNSVLGLMLPFGAIDETVRLGGNYIVRYQTDPAQVLDVFYCPSGGKRYLLSDGFSTTDYTTLVGSYTGTDNKGNRRDYSGAVIGWYGGEGDEVETGEKLTAPDIKIINKEKLIVEVTNNNYGNTNAQLKLIIEGETSNAKKAITLTSTMVDNRVGIGVATSTQTFTITLDDITSSNELQFSNLGSDTEDASFIPGENITVYAVSYSNTVYTNVASSSKKTTNSLYADLTTAGTGTVGTDNSVALITNLRHLENLSESISAVDLTSLKITGAEQKTDLSWSGFASGIKTLNGSVDESSDPSIYYKATSGAESYSNSGSGYYVPVNVTNESTPISFAYDGISHRISGITVRYDGTGGKGIFGEYGSSDTSTSSTIANLEIVDFSMSTPANESSPGTGTGNAGALAGTLQNTSVTNVLARNSSSYTATVNVKAKSNAAGGLIGSMSGGSVKASAASVYVLAEEGNAGGLIGTVTDGGTITGCYSGGHTFNDTGTYSYNVDTDNASSAGMINVIGGGNVGGLIGDAGSAAISQSYSTCSAYGSSDSSYVGGLVGKTTGSVSTSYATGYVSGAGAVAAGADGTDDTTIVQSKIGAFAGSLGSATDCNYFIIINERYSEDNGFRYLSPVGGSSSHTNITAFDQDASTYQDFANWSTESDTTVADAVPYDTLVAGYYSNKYVLKSVAQLGFSVSDGYYIETHYGDWPMSDVVTINT